MKGLLKKYIRRNNQAFEVVFTYSALLPHISTHKVLKAKLILRRKEELTGGDDDINTILREKPLFYS